LNLSWIIFRIILTIKELCFFWRDYHPRTVCGLQKIVGIACELSNSRVKKLLVFVDCRGGCHNLRFCVVTMIVYVFLDFSIFCSPGQWAGIDIYSWLKFQFVVSPGSFSDSRSIVSIGLGWTKPANSLNWSFSSAFDSF
jgi:hypothetical protein